MNDNQKITRIFYNTVVNNKKENMSTEATKTTASGVIGFGRLLTVLFIGLKLTGYITWSWWWVFAPLYMPFALVITILLGVLIVYLLGIVFLSIIKKRRK